jgi:hypothetical protein
LSAAQSVPVIRQPPSSNCRVRFNS